MVEERIVMDCQIWPDIEGVIRAGFGWQKKKGREFYLMTLVRRMSIGEKEDSRGRKRKKSICTCALWSKGQKFKRKGGWDEEEEEEERRSLIVPKGVKRLS